MTASTSPQARLQPRAARNIVRISALPDSATDTAPVKVSAMSRPNSISEIRSTGLSTSASRAPAPAAAAAGPPSAERRATVTWRGSHGLLPFISFLCSCLEGLACSIQSQARRRVAHSLLGQRGHGRARSVLRSRSPRSPALERPHHRPRVERSDDEQGDAGRGGSLPTSFPTEASSMAGPSRIHIVMRALTQNEGGQTGGLSADQPHRPQIVDRDDPQHQHPEDSATSTGRSRLASAIAAPISVDPTSIVPGRARAWSRRPAGRAPRSS